MHYKDIHNHTHWSDGDGTVEMLINRARKYHLQELGICDHYEAIEHKRTYNQAIRDEIKNLQDVKVVVGVEIRIGTLLRLSTEELNGLNLYDYILVENIEYQADIPDTLQKVKNLLNSLQCKIGFAHLDLERLGEHRKQVVDFMGQHNIFLDFNFEGTFYINLIQGYGQIEDVLVSGVEVVVGSDTHSIEEDWWTNLVAAHNYISNTCKALVEKRLGNQMELEKKLINVANEEEARVYSKQLDEVNNGIDSLIKRLPVALEYCKVESIRSDTNKMQWDYYYASLGGGLWASSRCESIQKLQHIKLYHTWVDA